MPVDFEIYVFPGFSPTHKAFVFARGYGGTGTRNPDFLLMLSKLYLWFINFCTLENLNINAINNKSVFVIDGYLFTNSYFYNQLKTEYSSDSKMFDIAHDLIRNPGVFKRLFVLIVDNNNNNNNATHACFHYEKEDVIVKIIKK